MGRTNDISIDGASSSDFSRKVTSNIQLFTQVQAVISSPLTRCVQTTNLLLRNLSTSVQITTDEGFTETDMGSFEGKTAEIIQKVYPKEFELWQHSSPNFVFPGGESYLHVQYRAYSALNTVVSNYSDANSLVIITHVDVIKMLIFKILGVSVEMKRFLYIDNGSISCLETYKDGYKVKFMNL
jgi:broad specificity phosphatase PhoE